MKYVFEGHVIRLNKKDYDAWWQRFCFWMSEADYLRHLSDLDDWLNDTLDAAKRKNWFFLVSKILEKNSYDRLKKFT